MPPSTYRDQFVKLIDKGYLVQRKNSNTFDFYETPQRDTHTKNNDTPDGLDFTVDAQNVPQTVNDEAAEDIEININNTDNINNGCWRNKFLQRHNSNFKEDKHLTVDEMIDALERVLGALYQQ